jgi:hypothetical protein
VAQVAFALGSQLPRPRPATDSEQPNLRPFYYHPRSTAPTRAQRLARIRNLLAAGVQFTLVKMQPFGRPPTPYLQPNFCCGGRMTKKSNARQKLIYAGVAYLIKSETERLMMQNAPRPLLRKCGPEVYVRAREFQLLKFTLGQSGCGVFSSSAAAIRDAVKIMSNLN